ncbi:killer cell lectin-like receptor subfamily B member 1C isoform X3 [Phyllobates terribilis]|uniref:killer cell lectin-like receptor subfamily B member 1C isoform X3 n=1 Tax=Phyllobates terribilis TaxID=111132 RepID=UPI003CCB6BF0
MEQVTYSKLNLKKNPRHPPKTQSAEEVYHHIKEKDINQQPYENKTGSSVCQQADIEKYRNELSKELCPNKTDNSPGCLLCPSNWRLHGDHCYYYSEVTDRTWNQSQDDCKMMGADLLVIKNLDQKEIIQRSITQQVEKTYWIGLHRDGDVWRWVDGEHYSSSLFQIKIQGSGRCISMTGSGYYQGNCNSTNRWICVKKAMRI